MTPNESPAALLPTFDELTKRLGTPDPVFYAWRDSVPDKHWVKLDLSALRIGYELGRAIASTAPGASESRGSVPEEWVLVPREPDTNMCNAGWREIDAQGFSTDDTEVAPIFRAMLAAAPTPPAVASGEPPDWAIAQAVRERTNGRGHGSGTVHGSTWTCRCVACNFIIRARELARSAAAKGEG